jgi:inner membrane protein
MDSFTHIAIGACVGEAFFEKGFGKKAMFWGALAQSLPDIDFIASAWLNIPESMLAHRGFTHSFLFALLVVPVFSTIAQKVHRPQNISFLKWSSFFFIEILFHLFIDAFNNYGIGWLEPFNHTRFSFNVIYVADPFFSFAPVLAFVFLVYLNRYHNRRKIIWKIGLFLPLIYLSYCSYNKFKIDQLTSAFLKSQQIKHSTFFTTPAPIQNWLWYIVVSKDSGYFIGYHSLFENSRSIKLNYFKKNEGWLKNIADHKEVQELRRFSHEYFIIEKQNDTLIFNDLRFGQIIGWHYPKNHFVFHYYLSHPNENKLLIQRGRFSMWNRNEFSYFIQRIFH